VNLLNLWLLGGTLDLNISRDDIVALASLPQEKEKIVKSESQ
jgi:hypothetical protein